MNAADVSDPHPSSADRSSRGFGSFRNRLALITALGAAWRLGYLVIVKADQELLLNDSIYYSIQAGLNSEGRWFEDALTGQPGAEHGMLTSLYLTPWSIGSGGAVFRQRLAMTLLGIVTIAVIGLLGRGAVANGADRFVSANRPVVSPSSDTNGWGVAERVGLVAAAIAAVYPNLWVNDSLVMSESLAVLLVSLSLLVAVAHHHNPTVRSGIVLGVVTGLGALTRSEIALFIPAFAVLSTIVARRRGRPIGPAVAILGAALLTLLPWSVYNAQRFDAPVLLSTNDGNTLLGANCDITYYDDIGGWDLRCLGPFEPGRIGSEPGVPDPSERSRDRRDEAIDYIRDHMERLPVVVVARVGRLLDVYGLPTLVDNDVGEEKATWVVWAGIVCWWLLAVAAVIGWRALRRRRVGARWWLLVPVIAVLTTTVLFYGAHRIRAPAEPTVVVLAAVAIITGYERLAHSNDGRSRVRRR